MRNETKRILDETTRLPRLFKEMDGVLDDAYGLLETVSPSQPAGVQESIAALMKRMEAL